MGHGPFVICEDPEFIHRLRVPESGPEGHQQICANGDDNGGNECGPKSLDEHGFQIDSVACGDRRAPRGGRQHESAMAGCSDDKGDGGGVTITGQVVCTDSGRWSVQREFNRRIKKRFEELGIEIYNPVRRMVALTQMTNDLTQMTNESVQPDPEAGRP